MRQNVWAPYAYISISSKRSIDRSFFSLHKIAADFAIEATSIFLNDIRSTVGDDVFAKFLNLKSENSMALVIDVSGSMRGELEMIIPLIILNKS